MRFNPFKPLSAPEIAAKDLEDARRHLLGEQAKAEYHAKMAEYYRNTISRLSSYVAETKETA